MLLLSLSFTGTISVVVRMSFIIVSLVLKTGVAILDLLLPRMNFVWRLATRALIDMVPASFHTQVTCGILASFSYTSLNLPSFESQMYKHLEDVN